MLNRTSVNILSPSGEGLGFTELRHLLRRVWIINYSSKKRIYISSMLGLGRLVSFEGVDVHRLEFIVKHCSLVSPTSDLNTSLPLLERCLSRGRVGGHSVWEHLDVSVIRLQLLEFLCVLFSISATVLIKIIGTVCHLLVKISEQLVHLFSFISFGWVCISLLMGLLFQKPILVAWLVLLWQSVIPLYLELGDSLVNTFGRLA